MMLTSGEHISYIAILLFMVPQIRAVIQIGGQYDISIGNDIVTISSFEPNESIILPDRCKLRENIASIGDNKCQFRKVAIDEKIDWRSQFIHVTQFDKHSSVVYLDWLHKYGNSVYNYVLRVNLNDLTCNVFTIEIRKLKNFSSYINPCIEKLDEKFLEMCYVFHCYPENNNNNLNTQLELGSKRTYISNIEAEQEIPTESKLDYITNPKLNCDLYRVPFLLTLATLILVVIIFIIVLVYIWKKYKIIEYQQWKDYCDLNIYKNASTRSDGYLTPKLPEPHTYQDIIFGPPSPEPHYEMAPLTNTALKTEKESRRKDIMFT
ncbi:uncharacterized protein LOC126886418 [Diabrotica virgifera virgifera]|uniref:Uncharacterized protein n=1 Tax=Diabrotica virgifera virgifera TaxID=50390 RepID=A0ABM5KGN3_DIAVI|nr:uncharacterized protein LOC126886418 [Diabrotica virgifera virgifera]